MSDDTRSADRLGARTAGSPVASLRRLLVQRRPQHHETPAEEPLPSSAQDSSASSPTTHDTETADPGWTYHEAQDGVGHEGWLYHFADGVTVDAAGTPVDVAAATAAPALSAEPGPAHHECPLDASGPTTSALSAEPEAEPTREPAAGIPAFVEYSPTNLPSYLFGAVFVVASVAAVLSTLLALEDGTHDSVVRAGALAVIAGVAWAALMTWHPTVVMVRDGVLEVSRGARARSADLRDPDTEVVQGGNPRSPLWQVTVRRPDQRPIVVRGHQVRRRQLARILDHHAAEPRQAHQDEEAPAVQPG